MISNPVPLIWPPVPRVRVHFLMNSPNNPTGTVYSTATMEAIAEYVQQNDLTLISDEVYDTQIWSGAHVSPRALPNMAERTIVIGSMSKSHAMTGSRIGWVIAPEEAIENMIDLATNTTYGVAGFVQDAALFALSQGEVFEEKIAAHLNDGAKLPEYFARVSKHSDDCAAWGNVSDVGYA